MSGQSDGYSVFSGGMESGYQRDQVVTAFASLFKLTTEKAACYVDSEKLIQNGLSQQDAKKYADRLKKIGLCVVIKGSTAANDHHVDSPVPDTQEPQNKPDPKAVPASASSSACVGAQKVCPKCNTLQPRQEVCVKCGLIFSKYTDPDRTTVETPEEKSEKNSLLSDIGSVADNVNDVIPRKLVALCVLLVVLLTGVTYTATSLLNMKGDLDTFAQLDRSGTQVKELIQVAGLSDAFDTFPSNIQQLFNEQFRPAVKRYGGLPARAERIMTLIPPAFTQKNADIALANYLHRNLSSAEQAEIISIMQADIVQEFNRHSGGGDSADRDKYMRRFNRQSLQPKRLEVLKQLANDLQLEHIMLQAWTEGQSTMLQLAAMTVPGTEIHEAQNRAYNDMSPDMIAMLKPMIKEEAIKALSWEYRDVLTADLDKYHSVIDKRIIRRLHRLIAESMRDNLSRTAYKILEKSGWYKSGY